MMFWMKAVDFYFERECHARGASGLLTDEDKVEDLKQPGRDLLSQDSPAVVFVVPTDDVNMRSDQGLRIHTG